MDGRRRGAFAWIPSHDKIREGEARGKERGKDTVCGPREDLLASLSTACKFQAVQVLPYLVTVGQENDIVDRSCGHGCVALTTAGS